MNLSLFLLLALTASWTGLVQCEDNEDTEEALQLTTILALETESEEKTSENQGDGAGSGDEKAADCDSQPNDESNTDRAVTIEETYPTAEANTEAETDDLTTVMIIIPVVLTLVLIAVIMCIVIVYRRRRIKAENTKEDPYLDHEDHEKVPMKVCRSRQRPMFEDDIPSVMELEMEDLENWVTKDGGKKVDTGQI